MLIQNIGAHRPKVIFVHSYVRIRLGRLEHVGHYWRSWPH